MVYCSIVNIFFIAHITSLHSTTQLKVCNSKTKKQPHQMYVLLKMSNDCFFSIRLKKLNRHDNNRSQDRAMFHKIWFSWWYFENCLKINNVDNTILALWICGGRKKKPQYCTQTNAGDTLRFLKSYKIFKLWETTNMMTKNPRCSRFAPTVCGHS